MSDNLVLTELRDRVAVITLNRPEKHNAMNDEMGPAMREAADWAYNHPTATVVLLRAEGKSFCSGRDITVLGHRASGDSDYEFVRKAQVGRLNQYDCPKPVIAAIKGYVLGGGCEMALAADIRVSASDLKMSLPEINYGILPDTGGTPMATSLAGPSRAKYMVLTGDRIGAETALSWGLVDFVVAPDELDNYAYDLADRMSKKAPLALAMGKQLVNSIWKDKIHNGVNQELVAQTALFGTEDYQEARAALREKREPAYKGK